MNIANNQLVTIEITEVFDISGQSLGPIQTSFITKLTPMYSTPLKVREVAGSYIAEISDDILNQLILKYSIEADMLSTCDTIAWPKWDFFASKWVTLKVAIDLIYNSDTYINAANNNGKIYKKLGDFSISTDSKTRDPLDGVKKFLTKLECEVFKLLPSVKFCKEPLLECDPDLLDDIASVYGVPAQTVIKGGARAGYPVFGRMFSQNGVHPQWTGWVQNNSRKYLTNHTDYN
ncbi:MAG: hypothetical protein PHY47_00405 [Lachnospiraceae bacterium]|nr:hypothetical protein [Lachnospiraceae bacterium]